MGPRNKNESGRPRARPGRAARRRDDPAKHGAHGAGPAVEDQRLLLREQTERLRVMVNESSWRHSALFDLAPIGYAVLDPAGRIEAVNLSLASLLEKPRSQVAGVPLAVMIPPGDRLLFLDHMQRCRASEGEAVTSNVRLLRAKGGEIFTRIVSRQAHRPGEPRLYLTAVLDLTARMMAERSLKQVEVRLRETNAELVRRAATAEHAAAQLRMLASQLNRIEQKERRRVAGLLHDHLQQFLVSAKIHLKITSRTGDDLPRRLQKVEGLIDQAIQASRTLTMELSPPVLHDAGLAAALAWLVRWMADKHRLHVHLEVRFASDPEDLPFKIFIFEAIREMLLNVVKHAGVPEAWVSVHRVEHEILVSVRDEGAGFDPAKFQKAEQGDHVGLMTLRERVRLLGGSLDMLSAPGRGTTVLLRCPLPATVTMKPAAARGFRSSRGSPPVNRDSTIRVLVVDDHHFLREGLIRILEEEGFSVVGEASDGREAVLKAREVAPHVVIMDVSLPELNGIDATRIIRRENPEVRVIGLSMHEQGDMEDGMRAAGAAVYLTKGGPVEQLLASIRQVAPVMGEERERST